MQRTQVVGLKMRSDQPFTSYCTLCGYEADSPARLASHHLSKHPGKEREFLSCQEFMNKFPGSSKICSLCRSVYLSNSARSRHFRDKHGTEKKMIRGKRMISAKRNKPVPKAVEEVLPQLPPTPQVPVVACTAPPVAVAHFSIFYDIENGVWGSSLPSFFPGDTPPQ